MMCISRKAINFHPSISIKNGVTSYCSGQPRTATSSYKYAARPKKDEKANPFDHIFLRLKLEALYSVKLLSFTFTGITC